MLEQVDPRHWKVAPRIYPDPDDGVKPCEQSAAAEVWTRRIAPAAAQARWGGATRRFY